MNFRSERLTIAQAKETDLVDYLFSLGYQPSKIRGVNYWYLSPLRTEKTPSFKINRKLNRWWDFGIGKGGSIIDFGMLYYSCTIPELLQILSGVLSLSPIPVAPSAHQHKDAPEQTIKIISAYTLSSASLTGYLAQRKIPIGIAETYCCELRYELNGKTWYGIGFKNDSGGYEIRNPYFKAGSTPKDITTVRNGADEVSVFEGFFDFLSYVVIRSKSGGAQTDYVVLNSLSFFEKARTVLEAYKTIYLYLDNDAAGQACSRHALSLAGPFRDESWLYREHKDLNDFLIYTGGGDTAHDKEKWKPP